MTGEESTKGTPLVKETHELLASHAQVDFYGNVEGRDLLPSYADVVVTDGFTGNVALKTLEGSLKFIFSTVLEVINTNEETKKAGDALFPFLLPLANELNPDNHGGAMLLGLKGICVISHGSSSSTAIMNALRVAAEMDATGVVDKVRPPAGNLVQQHKGVVMTTNTGNTSSLDRAQVLGIVKEELAEILEKSPDDISEDVPFTDLGADSLALIELVEALEETLASYAAGFHIDDEDLESVSLLLSSNDALAETLGLRPDSEVLALALTHSSYAAEHHVASNERLEFLGDAVVDLAVADLIVRDYPDLDEGASSVTRSRVVNEASLARAATRLDLARYVRIGKGVVKEQSWPRPRRCQVPSPSASTTPSASPST